VAPDGSSVGLNLRFVPTNFALPAGSQNLQYNVTGGRLP
jgi:hypothetical protein